MARKNGTKKRGFSDFLKSLSQIFSIGGTKTTDKAKKGIKSNKKILDELAKL